MFQPIKVLALDLERPIETLENLKDYGGVFALVRVHGLPVGTVTVPVRSGRCDAEALGEAILAQHWQAVVRRLLQCALRSPVPSGGFRIKDVLAVESQEPSAPGTPLVTVAVCTRDRTTSLSLCLDALTRLNYPTLDLLVVDNAPHNDATERLVRGRFPGMRYVRENRPGLDWARNRAIQEARGEIIAFTDDDAVPDPNWVRAIVCVFLENPEVMAVTGLVLPYELETPAQMLFEQYGGFGKGFERKWYRVGRENGGKGRFHLGAGQFGTGADMAYRRKLFDLIGGFDPTLDVGTVTHGGGDLEMFFRVLQEGYPLVYEPAAIVWHRHRRDYAGLKWQIRSWGIGLYAYLVRSALAYRTERWAILRFGLWYLWAGYLRRLFRRPLFARDHTVDLVRANLKGALLGPFCYLRARAHAAKIIRPFGTQAYANLLRRSVSANLLPQSQKLTAVRLVDLSRPLGDLIDVSDHSSVRVFVVWQDRLLGHVEIANRHQPICADRVRESIVSAIGLRLLDLHGQRDLNALQAESFAVLERHYLRRSTRPVARKLREEARIMARSLRPGTLFWLLADLTRPIRHPLGIRLSTFERLASYLIREK